MNESLESHLVHGRRQRPDGPSPVDVISVQSQLVYGYAGNSAAVPPLRALGVRVAEIPTTLLSNAPFYETTRGRVLPSDWFADLLLGAGERGLPQRARMLVSGYFGSVGTGDTHTGPYVEPGLEKVFVERLLPHAWLVTPNAFELGRLTGMPSLAQDDAIAASQALLARGPEWVLAHSVGGDPGQLVTLAVSRDAIWRWSSPHLPVDVAGTGDVLMSLLVAFLLRGETFEQAISRAIAGVHVALETTLANGHEEFDVLAAAPAALALPDRFVPERLA